MKINYTLEQVINQPREKVVQLIEDPKNLKEWQPGFISIEHISGEMGKVGSKYKLEYELGKRKTIMIETITERQIPEKYNLTFETDKVFNRQYNRFEEIDANTTKWISESEFELSGFMNIFGLFGKGMFKKQSQIYLDKFKEFAER